MQITVLIDNKGKEELLCEWGLSFLIDRGESRILLDFGASGAFAQNAAALGIDLATVDCAVLSHAHYDHGGGLPTFLELNGQAPIYIAAATAEDCWAGGRSHSSKGLWASLFGRRYIGLPKGAIDKAGERVRRVSGTLQIADGVWLIPHRDAKKAGRKQRLFRMLNGRLRSDDLQHELTLVCESDDGLVVMSSCSHAGPETILDEVQRALPGKKVTAYIGGLHLYKTGRAGILKVAKAFKDAGVDRLYTGHCTGERAMKMLKEKATVIQLFSGLQIR